MRYSEDQVILLGEYAIRRGRPEDRDGILETWNLVFQEHGPEFRPRTKRIWDWAFRDNPAGMEVWVAEAPNGQIVAQCAGIPLRVPYRGEMLRFNQIVDSFTHPDHRSGLKRPGLFAATARSYIDLMVWPDRTPVAFGFPMPVPLRLGRRFIGYETVRTQLYLIGEAPILEANAGALEVEEIGHAPQDTEDLYRRCVTEDCIFALRDAAWINWRWLTHPEYRYDLAVIREGAQLRGLAVFRPGHYATIDQGLLVDWLVVPGDVEAARALLAFAARKTRAAGLSRVGIFLADTDPWWLPLQRLQMKAHWTPMTLIYGLWPRDPRFQDLSLRAHWRYTFGETDFA